MDRGDVVVGGRLQGGRTVVRQPGCRQQRRVEVVLLVDHCLSDGRGVVQNAREVGAGVGIDVRDSGGATQILLQRRKFRVEPAQVGVQPGHRGTQVVAVTAQPFGQSGQRRVQVDGVDLAERVGQRLKQRVDFQLDVLGLDLGAGPQRFSRGVLRCEELDGLGAEDRGSRDPHRRVRRNVLHLSAADRQRQFGHVAGVVDGLDLADLYAPVLDLGFGLHDQAGPRREHRDLVGRRESGGVGEVGEHDRGEHDRGQDGRSDTDVAALGVTVCHESPT